MEIMSKEELEVRLSAFEERILNEIRNLYKNDNEVKDEQLNKKQVAELLGCSRNTSYKHFNHSDFPKPKITGKYSKKEIMQWMKKIERK